MLQDHAYSSLCSPPLNNQSHETLPKWPFDIYCILAIDGCGDIYFGIDVTQNLDWCYS